MSNLAAIVLFELPSVDSVCRRRQVRGFAHVALDKLVEAIAQFVQTQYCFDVERLREFMLEARELGLPKRCHILVGVGPLPSSRSALWMRNNVPGIPELGSRQSGVQV